MLRRLRRNDPTESRPFDIFCDHRRNYILFSLGCKAKAVKHLLHHPWNGYGKDPQVLLLCAEHFAEHIAYANSVLAEAHKQGRPLVLSSIVKDAGNI